MGCVASKKTIPSSPTIASSGASGNLEGSTGILAGSLWNRIDVDRRSESGESGKVSSRASSQSFRLGNLHKYIEGEQAAAGWPAWLSAVAKEAIHGWVPLKAESFQKLEKIGQGTYSSVFKARDLDTGRFVAIKKVRFDNFEPESVRFMAREILILRRLNHPNIVKLEGLITSRLSCSMYLVFEYMEHDLAGLTSSPDIKFSESQVKCYMHQLLSGLEHCHTRGIMHRDIKCANLLLNNEGILKVADFGLANFYNTSHRRPLTSRVVTLWYRPPELLLGATEYEATVDLWSVGCVFAELFVKKPILQGRTEVEQIHRIFKLCGSPPDEYWRKSNLPHATVFKPQQPYPSCLRETFKSLSESAFKLLETLVSVEPSKRGTAKSSLISEYFKTKPYACEPSSLPKYRPNREIDAKRREEAQRRRGSCREQGSDATTRPPGTYRTQQFNLRNATASGEESWIRTYNVDENGAKQDSCGVNGDSRLFVDLQPMPTINLPNKGHHTNYSLQGVPFSGPLSVSNSSTSSLWARNNASGVVDSSGVLQPKNTFELKTQANGDAGACGNLQSQKSYEITKQEMLKQWVQFENEHGSLNEPDDYHLQDLGCAQYKSDTKLSKHRQLDEGSRVEFSGPLLSESRKVDELLEKHERQIRQAVRRSWFHKG